MDYEDRVEVPIGDKVAKIAHEWKHVPEVRTTPIKCLLCEEQATAIFYCPRGCTCSPNKIQPRCEHHAYDTMDEMYILEDFRIWTKL